MSKRYTSYLVGFFVSLAVTLALLPNGTAAPPIYIFGDSILDVGTNNHIPESLARADMLFNGIDYPYSEPTGRFCNGLNTADEIVRLLGPTRSPPPFLYLVNDPSTFKQNILLGVNFASGGSGILNNTGNKPYKRVISLEEQIRQFSTVRSNITNMTLSEAATDKILSEAFYLISIGSNDIVEYLFNLTIPPNLSVPEFNATLISTYENHLKTLYNLGARKFGILAVPPVEITPFALANFRPEQIQLAAGFGQAFFVEAAALLKKFSNQVQGIRYSLANSYLMTKTTMANMLAFGFKNVSAACCGNGTYQCNQTASFCADRNEFLFWDRFHPTQKAAKLAALTLFGASEPLVTPINFSQLLGININGW